MILLGAVKMGILKMIDELIKELEQAECGANKLDWKFHKATGIDTESFPVTGRCWEEHSLSFTTSLDATENALPDGWKWLTLEYPWKNNGVGWAYCGIVNDSNDKDLTLTKQAEGVHKSLPISRSIAVLKAHKAANGE